MNEIEEYIAAVESRGEVELSKHNLPLLINGLINAGYSISKDQHGVYRVHRKMFNVQHNRSIKNNAIR